MRCCTMATMNNSCSFFPSEKKELINSLPHLKLSNIFELQEMVEEEHKPGGAT